jgi:hypothetical protein
MGDESVNVLEIKLARLREETLDAYPGVHITTDEVLREYCKENGAENFTATRFEEMHQLLKEAGLLTDEEYRIGPNYQTLTSARARISARRNN